MHHIISFLKCWPLHVLLLPVFFITSMAIRYAGLLDTGEMIVSFLKICAGLALAFILFLLLYKHKQKAAILATLSGVLVLFFGNIRQALLSLPLAGYLAHYRFFLPLLMLLAIYVLIKIKLAKKTAYTTLFLNTLFLLYLGIDAWNWLRLSSKEINATDYDYRLEPLPAGASAPGIYYIVPDGYPSTSYLQEVLRATSNPLDSILASRGFFLANDSRSNYNNTAFSMAAVLGMQYPQWLGDISQTEPHHYNRATVFVKNSPLFDWLAQNDYRLFNLSIFDLPGYPALKKERFLSATTTGMIFYHTFWNHLKWEIIPALFPSFHEKLLTTNRLNIKKRLETFRPYNKQVTDSLVRMVSRETYLRKFVYAHLEMPHFPYFYDESGKQYPDKIIYGDSMITHKERFLNYIAYTNLVIAALVDSILRQSRGKDIIVIQSDHGINDLAGSKKQDVFRNYSAIYFPDKDYRLLYPGMSNVNTFRIIFNKYFGQQLPLLSDSCFYIK